MLQPKIVSFYIKVEYNLATVLIIKDDKILEIENIKKKDLTKIMNIQILIFIQQGRFSIHVSLKQAVKYSVDLKSKKSHS